MVLEARRIAGLSPEKWEIVRTFGGDHTWAIGGSLADDEMTAWKRAARIMFSAHESIHEISRRLLGVEL